MKKPKPKKYLNSLIFVTIITIENYVNKDNQWNQPIEVEDTSLFQNYAEHIRTMIQNNKDNEKNSLIYYINYSIFVMMKPLKTKGFY